ncbi:type VI secretion protein [Streptomyces tsukubensis]|uniref:Type VI secretion protein n=1 Tax=Streptomyces tsukubensis TaxID=83656 RepID=A0A1V4A8B3_9ACTN|nr:type VI secretion protein [Streptomyces tsukubensis]OON78883.1 type VI secretion protein [Streptomyces tsukubensis]QFR94364.1 type VI secretion protein [Streptomyces tsukubensis]
MPEEGPRAQRKGGVPDGLLLSVLALILGVTFMVWTATGVAALFAHGAWPGGVTFTSTPGALRHLVQHPGDIAGAWPDTPRDQLSGYGLFWGLFIGALMVLLVLAIFVAGTLTRWRLQRASRRASAHARAQERPAPSLDKQSPTRRSQQTPVEGPPRGRQPHRPHNQDFDRPYTPAIGDALSTDHGYGSRPGPGSDQPPGGRYTSPSPDHGTVHRPATAPPVAPVPAPSLADTTRAPLTAQGPAVPVLPSDRATGALSDPTADSFTGGAAHVSAQAPTPRSPVFLGPAETRAPLAVQALLDAEGPALVVTSDHTVWTETKDARAKLGPVLVYDPAHLCDTPARLHWSPTDGCTDRAVAAGRATALLAPVRPASRLDAVMADTAETLLRCFLHAAAVDGRALKHVHRWSQGNGVQDAVRILRTSPKAASGAAGELEAALTSYQERREIAQELTSRTLAALSSIHIREACTPNRTDTVTLESFVPEGGTLYMVGEAIEDPKSRPGAMPLLTALASSVVERGRRMAERSSSGRLDPPLTLVLDDVAAVAPLPQLPELLADGPALGLPTLALLRSQEQARARWPHYELPL